MFGKLTSYLKKVFEPAHNERFWYKCNTCDVKIDGACMDDVILHEIKTKHTIWTLTKKQVYTTEEIIQMKKNIDEKITALDVLAKIDMKKQEDKLKEIK